MDWDTELLRAELEDLQERQKNLYAMLRQGAGIYETQRRQRQELEDNIRVAIEYIRRGEADAAMAILTESVLYL